MQINKVRGVAVGLGLVVSSVVWACDLEKVAVEASYVLAGPVGQQNTAGYGVIKNLGSAGCEIVGAESDIAGKVELHTIVMENGVFKMEAVKSFTVQAHGELSLEQGGNHLMFLGLKKPLKVGESVPVTLNFAGDKQKVEDFEVRDMKR